MAKKKSIDKTTKQDVFSINPFKELKRVVVVTPAPAAVKAAPVVDKSPKEPDETELFLQAMSDVSKIGSRQTGPGLKIKATKGATQSLPISGKQTELAKTEQDFFTNAIGQMKLDVKFADHFPEEDELKAIGGNRLRQLRKGIITVERQLDLHGLTRDEALESLARFLQSASYHAVKAVLVITGKGNNSPGEPVIQQAVAAWLRDAGRKLVVEFAPAPREMGGSGAFIVFLKN